ncbi:MAG TPA: hypothetical protein VGM80_02880 [Gaiellaceae bacterium]|jgi:adenylate kinase family enzyme
MERVAVIGCGGAGKTWFATRLAELTGLPLVHLDTEYWRGTRIRPPTADWERRHEELVAEPLWILDGNYGGTMAARFARADTIVFLDLPTLTCIRGALSRPSQGFPRVDLGFLRWIWRYRETRRPGIAEQLDRAPGTAVVLASRNEAAAWLSRLSLPGAESFSP